MGGFLFNELLLIKKKILSKAEVECIQMKVIVKVDTLCFRFCIKRDLKLYFSREVMA